MSEIKCIYYGDSKEEDIAISFEDHKVVFGEDPSPGMTNGCLFGSVRRGYTFLTPEKAEQLGTDLIVAATKAKRIRDLV
jgi:hypothetical protein